MSITIHNKRLPSSSSGFIRIHGETTPAGALSESGLSDLPLRTIYPPTLRLVIEIHLFSLPNDSSSGPVGNSINPSSLDAETKSRTAASARSSLSRKLLYHPSLCHQLYILTAIFVFCCAIMVAVSCSLRRGLLALAPSQCSPPRQI